LQAITHRPTIHYREQILSTARGKVLIFVNVGELNRVGVLILLALGGCATVPSRGEVSTKTYFGLVRVAVPSHEAGLSAVDVKALGVGWDKGPWLGWRAGNWVIADPAKCQLLIIIRTPAQAENAAKVLKSLGGQQACIADFTKPPGS
jgi:hypothetical protein